MNNKIDIICFKDGKIAVACPYSQFSTDEQLIAAYTEKYGFDKSQFYVIRCIIVVPDPTTNFKQTHILQLVAETA